MPSYGTKLLNITSYRFRCDHPSAPAPDQGRCGENLECKLRDDLDANDEPQVKAMVCAEKNPIKCMKNFLEKGGRCMWQGKNEDNRLVARLNC